MLAMSVLAQSGINTWSPPVEISQSLVAHTSPRILTDSYGRSHAFWVESTSLDRNQEAGEAIFYTHGDGHRWANANDVVAASGNIRDLAVILDAADRFHMLFVDQNSGDLLYSYSEMWNASQPLSWSTPQRIEDKRVSDATILANADQLFVAYTLWEEPFEVNFMHSDVIDISWSEPIQVSNVYGRWNETALNASLSIDRNGVLYLIWAQHALPEGYPPQRIMFVLSSDGGRTWTEPTQIKEGPYGLPLILASQDELYITYNGIAGIEGRYFRFSADQGASWSEQIVIDSGVGGLTGGTMAMDCAGTLHYASASDTGFNGIAYSQWVNGHWEPMHNVAGITPGTDEETRQGYEPAMTVAQCNQIHVIYLGANHTYVYHTYTKSDTPSVQPPTYSAPTASPTATSVPDATPLPTTPPIVLDDESSQPATVFPIHPIILGSLGALIFVAIVVFLRARR
jgi:hypothetical protein